MQVDSEVHTFWLFISLELKRDATLRLQFQELRTHFLSTLPTCQKDPKVQNVPNPDTLLKPTTPKPKPYSDL